VGKQQEKILEAKTEGLESDKIQAAMAERADFEADRLADQIIGASKPQLPRGAHANAIGYVQSLESQQSDRPTYRNEADDPNGQSR
jgi:hypothetical protein